MCSSLFPDWIGLSLETRSIMDYVHGRFDRSDMKRPRRTIITSLPTELLWEILTLLPVKTLLKLRVVCKSWNSTISDPSFHQYHLHQFRNNRTNNRDGNNRSLLLLSLEMRYLPTMSIRSTRTLKSIKKIDLDDFPYRYAMRSVVGYVDGVLLIHISNGPNVTVLWNPTIRKIVEIPSHELLKNRRVVNFGLGFDSVSNDYKVVAVHLNLKYHKSKTMVYSLGARSWTCPKEKQVKSRPIDGNNNVMYLSKNSRFINFEGGIYWTARPETKGKNYTHFVRFNLSDEAFTCVKLPAFKCEITGHKQRRRCLSVLHESIALVDCFGLGHSGQVRVWVRRNEGSTNNKVNGCSWVELYKLDLSRKSFVFLKSNGDIYLRKAAGKIAVYDSETMQEKNSSEASGEPLLMDDYTESLVLFVSKMSVLTTGYPGQ